MFDFRQTQNDFLYNMEGVQPMEILKLKATKTACMPTRQAGGA